MKRLLLIGVALIAVIMFVTPASATDLELGGYYRIEGRYLDNPSLTKDGDQDSQAYWRHRFRFQPALVVSDNLRFDFKADIFDGTHWGTEAPGSGLTAKAKSTDVIDVDRLWMTVKVPFGSFAGGRMPAGAWGLTFGDDNEEADRVRFDTKFGNFATGIILQKNVESDNQDSDGDTYYLYGNYKADFGSAGLLFAYTSNKSKTTYDMTKYNLLPYADLQFGNIGVRGELIWATGSYDANAAGAVDTDIDELAWNLEADVTFGPFTVMAGYAWVQGEDSDPTDATATNLAYGGIGDDWSNLVVMMDVDGVINGFASDAVSGKISPARDPIAFTGVKLAYAELTWKATKDWKVWVDLGWAKTQTTDLFPGADDEIGKEYDISAQWNVMKNFKFLVRAGYFDTGDFFETVNGVGNTDPTFTAYHQWTLSF